MSDNEGLVANAEPMGDIEAQETLQPQQTILQQSSHPAALVFHILFKMTALGIYLFGWILSSNFIICFVLIILSLSFDFWTVQNVSGRLLVGLRYWNQIKEDGTNEWIFESKPNRAVNPTDSNLFWSALYLTPLCWTVLAIFALFQLKASWFIVTVIAISMSSANLIGYTKCDKDARKKVASYVAQQPFVRNMFFSSIFG